MITLDIEEFKSNIKNLEDTSLRKYTGGTRYLYDTIYSALIEERIICAGDVDFSRFSAEEYKAFHNKAIKEEESIRKIHSVFGESMPCSVSEGKEFF